MQCCRQWILFEIIINSNCHNGVSGSGRGNGKHCSREAVWLLSQRYHCWAQRKFRFTILVYRSPVRWYSQSQLKYSSVKLLIVLCVMRQSTVCFTLAAALPQRQNSHDTAGILRHYCKEDRHVTPHRGAATEDEFCPVSIQRTSQKRAH